MLVSPSFLEFHSHFFSLSTKCIAKSARGKVSRTARADRKLNLSAHAPSSGLSLHPLLIVEHETTLWLTRFFQHYVHSSLPSLARSYDRIYIIIKTITSPPVSSVLLLLRRSAFVIKILQRIRLFLATDILNHLEKFNHFFCIIITNKIIQF